MHWIRPTLIAGLAVTVPAAATFFVLRWLFATLDSVLGPAVAEVLGRRIPGLGVLATLTLVLSVGLLARNYVGARLIAFTEGLFQRLPIVRRIYGATKEITDSAILAKKSAFRDVVLVEYPRPGMYSYGFVTSISNWNDPPSPSRRLAHVFIPGPPVPTSGFLVAVPEEDVVYVDLPVDDALKLVLSAGMAAPKELRRVDSAPTTGDPGGSGRTPPPRAD